MYGFLLLNRLVQPRLCERGLIAFVVAEAPITVQVDDGVLLEFSPEIQGESHYVGDGFGVITVHVKNGNLQHLDDVGRVSRGPRFPRSRRESDLVVDNDVKRAADLIAVKPAEIQTLLNNAFTGKTCIAVNQKHHAADPLGVTGSVLFGPDAPQGHWIYELKVARVKTQRQMDFVARPSLVIITMT